MISEERLVFLRAAAKRMTIHSGLASYWRSTVLQLLGEVGKLHRMLGDIYTVVNDSGDLDELVGIFEEARYGEDE